MHVPYLRHFAKDWYIGPTESDMCITVSQGLLLLVMLDGGGVGAQLF